MARAILLRTDPTRASLLATADEFDAQAAAIKASHATAQVIGYDDVSEAREQDNEVQPSGDDEARTI